MSKSMPRAFQKCVTYGGADDLSHSYKPSKSSQISKKKFWDKGCQKKITRAQKNFKSLFLLREVSKLDLKTSLRRNKDLKFF